MPANTIQYAHAESKILIIQPPDWNQPKEYFAEIRVFLGPGTESLPATAETIPGGRAFIRCESLFNSGPKGSIPLPLEIGDIVEFALEGADVRVLAVTKGRYTLAAPDQKDSLHSTLQGNPAGLSSPIMKHTKTFDTVVRGGEGFLTLSRENILWVHDYIDQHGHFVDIGTACGKLRVQLVEDRTEYAMTVQESGAGMVCGIDDEHQWCEFVDWLHGKDDKSEKGGGCEGEGNSDDTGAPAPRPPVEPHGGASNALPAQVEGAKADDREQHQVIAVGVRSSITVEAPNGSYLPINSGNKNIGYICHKHPSGDHYGKIAIYPDFWNLLCAAGFREQLTQIWRAPYGNSNTMNGDIREIRPVGNSPRHAIKWLEQYFVVHNNSVF